MVILFYELALRCGHALVSVVCRELVRRFDTLIQDCLWNIASVGSLIPYRANFRGSKWWFSKISLNFTNSLSKPCTCRTCNVVWVWHTSQILSNMHCHTIVRAQPRSCQQSNAYFEDIPLWRAPQCGFSSMLSIDALAREKV